MYSCMLLMHAQRNTRVQMLVQMHIRASVDCFVAQATGDTGKAAEAAYAQWDS